jgi:hypothetical protein
MAFLATHNLPMVGWFLSSYLVFSEGQEEDKERLVAVLIPKALELSEGKPAGKQPGKAGGLPTEHTIASLKEIGLIEEVDGIVKFGPAVNREEKDDLTSPEKFFRLVRRLVLSDQAAGDPWRLRGERWDTAGSRDLVRGLAWLLAQDALTGPLDWDTAEASSDAERLQGEQFRDSGRPKPISSATGWEDFVRWATVLGFATRIPRKRRIYLAPDPTHAIRDVLRKHLGGPGKGWQPLPEVLDHLTRSLPVLAGGSFSLGLEKLLQTAPDSTGRQGVPSSTSQALLTLRDAGILDLEHRADAPTAVLSDAPRATPYSHVRLTEVT